MLPAKGAPLSGSVTTTGRPVAGHRLREVAAPFGRRRDAGGARGGVAISRPLVVQGYVRPIARDQAGDLQRTAEGQQALCAGVGRLGRVLSGKRERAGVPERIAEDQAEGAVVERSPARTVVAERARLRERRGQAVVHAAVDQESIRGRLAEFPGRVGGGGFRLWGVSGGVQIRALKG